MELYRYPEAAHAPRNEYVPPSSDAMQESALRLPAVPTRGDGTGAEDQTGAPFAQPARHSPYDDTRYLPMPMSIPTPMPIGSRRSAERAEPEYDGSPELARERHDELDRLRSVVGALERTITQLTERLDTQADTRTGTRTGTRTDTRTDTRIGQRAVAPEIPMYSMSTDASASVLRTIRTALWVVGGCMLALLVVIAVCMCVSCARSTSPSRAAVVSPP